jgi:signal transduction histidine kinase
MVLNRGLQSQAVIDGLGQGVLIFDTANRLVMENQAARTILGADLKLIRSEGWKAAAVLFNTRLSDPDQSLDVIRAKALASERPVRFHAYRSGEHVPCWAAAIHGTGGEVYTMLTLDVPDWTALSELMEKYLDEVRDAVDSTAGHADLILQSVGRPKPNETVEQLGRRITGFARIIDIHMNRLGALTSLVERLEKVRTNIVRDEVRAGRRRLNLASFMEDFLEELDEHALADPESESQDFRRRLQTSIPADLAVIASPAHLAVILRDLLRNAIMYSLKAAPVYVVAHGRDRTVQIDVIDEGYGIRASEAERVFALFMRSRQPQVIGEFGYGLSLYLCKHEVEAMNGRIWFESEEAVGTTFSLKLPAWLDDSSGSESE